MSPDPALPIFDPAIVYAKTGPGRQEITRRAMGLGSRQRSVLIMVDGHKSGAELAALMAPGLVAGIVGELLALGLVMAPGAPPPPDAAPGLARIKQRMRETAESCLGLMAADVVRRIERAPDAAALLGVLGQWHMALLESRSGKALAPALVEEMRIALGGA